MHRGGFGAAIGDRDPHVDVVGCRLGVFDVDVGVAIVVEHPGVEQLVLHLQPAALGVGGDEVAVRELPQRVPVTALQVGGGRRGVEEEVVLLDVLAVVALGVGQTEHPLLEDRVDAVPHGERQAEALVIVGDAGDAVLAPLVGARPRLIVAEVAPRVTVGAVVLAHGAPLPLAEVWAPRLPWHAAACLVQASCFLSRPHRCASRRLGRGDAEASTPPGDSAIESDGRADGAARTTDRTGAVGGLATRPLGGSGLDVSVMSLGSWRTFERISRDRGRGGDERRPVGRRDDARRRPLRRRERRRTDRDRLLRGRLRGAVPGRRVGARRRRRQQQAVVGVLAAAVGAATSSTPRWDGWASTTSTSSTPSTRRRRSPSRPSSSRSPG